MPSKEFNIDKVATAAVNIANALDRIADVLEDCETQYGTHAALCIVSAKDIMNETRKEMKTLGEIIEGD
jgi:methylthioribose-1-phosphate isomerase